MGQGVVVLNWINLFVGLFKTPKKVGRSNKWPGVRKRFLTLQPFCQACGRKANLEVHHIVPFHIQPELELDQNNLITLCGEHCHFVFGHFMDWKLYNPNVVLEAASYFYRKQNAKNN